MIRNKLWHGWWLWLALMCALLLWAWNAGQLRVESNMLALLPESHRDVAVEQAWSRLSEQLSQQLWIAVSAPEDQLESAVEMLRQAIADTDDIELVPALDASAQAEVFELYRRHHTGLLAESDRQALRQGQAGQVVDRAMQRMLQPGMPVSGRMLQQDPFLLLPGFLQERGQIGLGFSSEGVLRARAQDGRVYALLEARLVGEPFSLKLHSRLRDWERRIRRDFASEFPHGDLRLTGVGFYAAHGSTQARGEAGLIAGVSLLAIVLLMGWVFASLRQLLLCLMSVGVGVISGLTVTLLLFGSVHLITLVFGATLIGISVDYAFHYFTSRLLASTNEAGSTALKRVLPAIAIGASSSIIAFAALSLTPFPGVRQLSVFAVFGLFAAVLTVVAVFPRFTRGGGQAVATHPLARLSHWYVGRWRARPVPGLVAAGLVVMGGIAALSVLQSDDDVRALQSPSAELQVDERLIRGLLGREYSGQVLVVQADSNEQLLRLEEQVAEHLRPMLGDDLDDYYAISRWLPSSQKQAENRKLVVEQLLASELPPYAEWLGLSDAQVEAIGDYWRRSPPPLLPHDWLTSPFGQRLGFAHVGEIDGRQFSVMLLEGVAHADPLQRLADELDSVSYLSKTDEISAALGVYRLRLIWLLLAGYALIAVLMITRYGWLRTSAILAAPMLAAMAAVIAVVLMNGQWNLFHTLALVLVLGIGIDYTIFLVESADHRRSSQLAVLLSGITTLLAFGLLASSSMPALSGFGLVVLVGIAGSMLFAPLVLLADRRARSAAS